MPLFSKLTIYYFSGTGNAFNVSVWISQIAKIYYIPYRIVNITKVNVKELAEHQEDELIAFVSPVHGFNYPPVMLSFLAGFPRGKAKVILLNTRAGMLIKKWITPGLSGITFYFASLILLIKGYRIYGMLPVDMPSNWMSIHPGLNDRTIKYLHVKNKERITSFTKKIFSGKKVFSALKEAVQDLAIAPVSLMYYIIGRFVFAKTYYASHACDNCNVCVKNCPVKAIKIVNNRPYWTFECESCMKCMSSCPKKAIQTGHGFISLVILLQYSGLLVIFYKYFNRYIYYIQSETIKFFLESAIFVTLLSVCYRLVHYLMRFGFFEKIMLYTSFTRYNFWGKRYRALRPD
jgi:ferredoxin